MHSLNVILKSISEVAAVNNEHEFSIENCRLRKILVQGLSHAYGQIAKYLLRICDVL